MPEKKKLLRGVRWVLGRGWQIAFAIGILAGFIVGFGLVFQGTAGVRLFLAIPLVVGTYWWMALHVYRWAAVVSGMLCWAVLGCLQSLANGHNQVPPFHPQPRLLSLLWGIAMVAYIAANESVRRRHAGMLDQVGLASGILLTTLVLFLGKSFYFLPAAFASGALMLSVVWLIGQKRHPARRRRTARAKAHPDSASTG